MTAEGLGPEEFGSLLRSFYAAQEPLLSEGPAAAEYARTCVERPGLHVAVVRGSAGGLGIGLIRSLDLDTEIFGMRMARVEAVGATPNTDSMPDRLFQQMVEMARGLGIQHLLFRCPALLADWVRAAQAQGFSYVSTNLFLRRGVKAIERADLGIFQLDVARSGDEGALLEITEESFSDGTRFHLDPRLGEPGATELHRRWLANSLAGAVADCVLVCREHGIVVGFITGRLDRDLSAVLATGVGRLDLFAVARRARHRGVGAMLIGAFLSWLLDQGGEVACVSTEVFNAAALNAYIASGFRVSHAMHNLSWGDA